MAPRSFLPMLLPAAANLATAPRGVAFDAWPPVLEYTSVSSTRMLTSRPLDNTWSRPPKPMSYAHPSPPMIQMPLLTRASATDARWSAAAWCSSVVGDVAEHGPQPSHALALRSDAPLVGLVGVEDLDGQIGTDDRSQLLDQQPRLCLLSLVAEPDPEPELGVVLEQRVVPGRAASLGVRRPRRGGQVGAVDGRAPGGVGDDHAVAEQLGDELDVGRLAAAGTGTGELEQRLERLGTLHRVVRQDVAVDLGKRQEELPRPPLGLTMGRRRLHVDGLVPHL